MKHILGISAGFHDSAASVIDTDGNILFAAHGERYSKIKNDPNLPSDILFELARYNLNTVSFYERPWMHNLQQFRSGQRLYGPWTATSAIKQHLQLGAHARPKFKIESHAHHLSHAAAGFQTSPFQEAAVVVIDAIGELDTISIYRAWYDAQGRARYKRVWRQRYPHSIGLFYSAITKTVGLKPMEEEYITMGMSAYGQAWRYIHEMKHRVLADREDILFSRNLHIGFDDHEWTTYNVNDVAAAAQCLVEELVHKVVSKARKLIDSDNLVYMGGVALNCVANARLGSIYDNTWIMPNPGDAGSSLGAAALSYGRKLHWRDAYLGHVIPGAYPVKDLLDALSNNKIVGVASAAAEFGPRALGNRSLLADPRGADIKDRVNEIKRRQKFRPFAPVILAEMVDEYFDMPPGWHHSDYMQVVAQCRRPDLFPAICHVDGTSRVQTVPKNSRSGIRQLLEQWYAMTGCPMLLNTSLNIRSEPMVNDRSDADRFQKLYSVPVLS
jgi:carbamoyltransferase